MKIEKIKSATLENRYNVGDLFLDTGTYPGFIKIKSIDNDKCITAKLDIGKEDIPENWYSYGSSIHKEYIPITSIEEALSIHIEVTNNPEKLIVNKEKDFIKLVMNRTNKTENEVIEAVNWWKFKNKWKRSINSDDAKALRMIEGKLNKLTISIKEE